MTSKQVKELCEGDGLEVDASESIDKLPVAALKMAKATRLINTATPQQLARALIEQEGDVVIARARLQAVQKLLNETEQFLTAE